MAELLLFHVVSMDGFGQIAGLAPQTMARQNEDPNSGMVSSVSKVSVLYNITVLINIVGCVIISFQYIIFMTQHFV